jgi:hypothetical protein
LLVGARNKAERKETEKFLANFVRVNINEAITDNAVDKKATQVARSLDATATAEAKAEIATNYGTVNSYKCFKNANDADICQPLLSNAFYTK